MLAVIVTAILAIPAFWISAEILIFMTRWHVALCSVFDSVAPYYLKPGLPEDYEAPPVFNAVRAPYVFNMFICL